ncbi:Cytochrome c [Limimonas halophila]|uniref:Cytochrome c n=1 Tax=Limimonas halophila TaxID=1082479 RepID=A0A1G7UUP1_9PROT|nr:c-type cytochrome [Limimonas halophila]SDG51325.1 Cytochrome c [Limimonas halophila]
MRSAAAGIAVAMLAGGAFGAAAGELPDGEATEGKRFYWNGVTSDGEPVPAIVQGDIESTSDNFTCVGCHRPSGFGSSEGSTFVPPITGEVLFSERLLNRERRNRRFRELFKQEHSSGFDARVRMPNMRPAYTEETLARAIREGTDSAGRTLSEAMPRYKMSDQAVANLIAYLKDLSAEKDPGVGEKTMHLATVVGPNVDESKAQAMLRTMRAFIEWYNKDIQTQMNKPNFSPYYRSEFADAYRLWDLHVWRLEGAPSTWRKQLEKRYERRPVFAVVSGLVDGPWAPVDGFCDSNGIPCVFPNTVLPDTDDATYGYSVYFSPGLELEGEALAAHLSNQDPQPKRVHQIHAADPAGTVPADAFADRAERALPATRMTSAEVASRDALTAEIAEAADRETDVLAIWPGDHVEAAVAALNANPPAAERVVLPSTALAAAKEKLSEKLRPKVRLTHPYEKPTGYHPRSFRVRAWMNSRGIGVSHERVQMQTYYALTQMQFSVNHLVTDFYRDYLLEYIEQEAEAELNPGTHPELSLGPGVRFASNGAYIVKLDPDAKDGYKAVSEWIVP